MMTLLEEDDRASDRDEIYCQRRVKLFQMLEEFNNSYSSLAEKYDQLRSESRHQTNPGSLPSSCSNANAKTKHLQSSTGSIPFACSNTNEKARHVRSSAGFVSSACSNINEQTRYIRTSTNSELELFDSYLDSILADPGADCDDTGFNFEHLNKLVEELMSTEPHTQSMKMKKKLDIGENNYYEDTIELRDKKGINVTMDNSNLFQDQATVTCLPENSYEQVIGWSELQFQVTKLVEENLKQQVELARRNIQKRVVINRLRSQLEHLKGENRALQSCISCLKGEEKPSQFQTPKLRKIFSSRFF